MSSPFLSFSAFWFLYMNSAILSLPVPWGSASALFHRIWQRIVEPHRQKGTVWKISAIPLGGYCQFLGDADESSSTSDVDLSKYTEEEQKHLFATQTPYKKLAIAIAGPLFNYLFAFITFFGLFYFVGSYDIPPIVSEVIKESPAEKPAL